MNDDWNGPNGQSCGNCFFWVGEAPATLRECRRYPPSLFLMTPERTTGIVYDTQVPETMGDNWCGEWKGRG